MLPWRNGQISSGASTIQGELAMPFFNDIDDWREWNDNRYIDDSGEQEEREDESNEDEECDQA